MKLFAFAIFDDKAKAFTIPFFAQNANMALRSFGDAVLNEQTGISKHASDYKLYQVGCFDDNAGVFDKKLFDKPEFIANAVDFVPAKAEVVNE